MNVKDNKAVEELRQKTKGANAIRIVEEAVRYFGSKDIALASSLGAEDQVLTHMLRSVGPDVKIFTIDTGRLPQETYDVMQETAEKYKFNYEVLFPDAKEIANLVGANGPNLFYYSVDLRKMCCGVRKVVPLKKRLKSLRAWFCGLRKAQGVTRTDIEAIEWDDGNGLVKVNPIVSWTDADVWKYIKENKIPYNKLHDKGYPSIGCAPCTRAIEPGEDVRAGRWWWESPEHKECGLHRRKK